MQEFFRQFSFPGGIGSHCTPETPGSIHEGGELGYVLSHACGAAFDNPDLIVAAVVGDGESETGPLATSWHINKFLNPDAGWRGTAHSPLKRLQDRQSDVAGANFARGAGEPVPRIRLDPLFRRRLRCRHDASGDGGDHRTLRSGNSRASGSGPQDGTG